MFTFLNSAFAWALLAAAIPILIHLFTRKKLKRIPFSSLKFLQAMQKEKIRQVRIKQLLLLLLRTLIIFLLIAAFLRPTLKTSDFAVGQRARTSMVIIVDNSLSMAITRRGQSKLTEHRQRAQEVLQLQQPGDDVSLVTAAYPARQVNESPLYNAENASSALESIEQRASSTDLQGALEIAASALAASRNLNKEIYVFSDLQAELPNATALELSGQSTRLFVQNEQADPQRNLSLSSLRIDNQIFELRKPVELSVEVKNNGPIDENGKMVYLLLNGSRVAQGQVDVPAGESRSVLFRVVPDKPGYQLLTAELENDALSLDNRAYSLFYIQERTDVLLVGGDADDRLYLRLALQESIAEGGMQLEEMDAAQLSRVKFQAYDLVVFCNVPSLSPEVGQRLQNYLENGGGAVSFLGNAVDLRNYNEQLFERFGLGQLGESVGSQQGGQAILRLGTVNNNHPIFQGVFEQGESEKIDSPEFRFAVVARPAADAEVVMRYSNEAPFLLEKRVKDGLLLAYLASADAEWSDLPFKGIFAPLVNRSIRYVAGQGGMPGREIFAGQPAQVSLAGENLQQFSVVTPDQSVQQIRPNIVNGRFAVSVDETRQTGFYTLMADGKVQYVWAVNFDAAELDTPPLPNETFREIYGENNVVVLDAETPMQAALQSWRYGSELWQLFFVLALIGLLAEMLLFRTKKESTSVKPS